jgi:hypothetical protein
LAVAWNSSPAQLDCQGRDQYFDFGDETVTAGVARCKNELTTSTVNLASIHSFRVATIL